MRKKMANILFFLMALIFIFICLGTCFSNKTLYVVATTKTNVLCMLFAIVFLFCYVNFCSKKIKNIKPKTEKKYYIIFSIILLVFQLLITIYLKCLPSWDWKEVYVGALNLSDYSVGYPAWYYLGLFPNNMSLFILEAVVFRILKIFSILKYSLEVTHIINIILMNITILLTILIIRKKYGKEIAIIASPLMLLYSAFYIYLPILYTDTLAIVFPVSILYLYTKLKDENNNSFNIKILIVISILAAIGMTFKITVAIMIIAIWVDLFIKKEKQYKKYLLTSFLSLLLVFSTLNVLMSNIPVIKNNVDKSLSVSYSHWIMMGLHEYPSGLEGKNRYGAYSTDDFIFTYSLEGKKNQIKEHVKEIKKTIKQRGIKGNIIFGVNKILFMWGDGTYIGNALISTNATHPNSLIFNIFSSTGKYFKLTYIKDMVLMFSIYILLIFALINSIKNGYHEVDCAHIAIFGLLLFFIIWEASSRYLMHYVPIIIIAALSGIKYFYRITERTIQCIKDYNKGSGLLRKKEKKIIDFCKKNYIVLFAIIITIVALIIRLKMFNFVSADFKMFLEKWFYQLKNAGGIHGIKYYSGDYNAPYVTIMALLTYIPIKPLYSIKIVSVIADFMLAISSALLVNKIVTKNKREISLLTYSIILLLPNVLLNGACWAQCDSLYSTFIVLALYFYFNKKYSKAFIMLGVSFAFKLQTVFIIPLFIILYISEQKYGILNFLLIPIVNFVLCIPAIILGFPLKNCLMTYINQTGTYKDALVMNFPNIWNILKVDPGIFYPVGTMLVVAMCGIILYMCIYKKLKFDKEKILLISIWLMMLITFVLPGMHERYLFAAEIISVIYFILYKKYGYVMCSIIGISMITYGSYLGNNMFPYMNVLSLVYLVIIIIFTNDIYINYIKGGKDEKK